MRTLLSLPEQEEMDAAQIPWAWRDYCAHKLIPLNDCRHDNLYAPWACKHERHVYEKCQYKEFKRRVAILLEEKRRAGLL
jgi:NADH dehydrogenase (ubiquinone) 1 beta subcomplex subunit 7